MEILRACHSLFLKAPMIGELAAEGGLRGCFFSENGEQPLSQLR